MCPPGVDQTTRRPQRWNLLALNVEERAEMPLCRWGEGCRTLRELISRMSTSHAFEKLAKREVTRQGSIKEVSPSHQLSFVETLPAELLAMVLASPGLSKADIAAFGVCSQTTWMHTLLHIRSTHCTSAGDWTGMPLICTGSYLTDIPPALAELRPEFVEEEIVFKAAVRAADSKNGRGRGCGSMGGPGKCPARRWNWGADSSFKSIADKDAKMEWKQAVSKALSEDEKLVEQLSNDLDDAMHFEKGPVDGKWLLRNLARKESVKLNVAGRKNGQAHAIVKGIAGLPLDKALMARICWSTDDDSPGSDHERANMVLRRGEWAAHSFEIVRDDVGSIPDGWKDVTDDLLKHATAVGVVGEQDPNAQEYVGLLSSKFAKREDRW